MGNPQSAIRNPQVTDWTIGALLDWTANFLVQKGAEFPRLDAEVLLAHALGCKRIELYTRYTDMATAEQRQRYRELIGKRVEGCPVAFLVGRKEFFSLELEVSPAVLIPRPDSEHVVMECLRLAKELAGPTVLDVGAGSGNLAIAIAHRHKGAKVTAIDVSAEALAVAQRNAERHGVAARVTFRQGDLFAPVAGEQFDFVVSNPPYIPHDDIAKLAAGVRDYEPHQALDGGSDGFGVFDRLVAEAGQQLNSGGYLIVEIGAPQEATAREKIAALSDALNNKKNLSGRLAAARALPKFGPPAKAATPGLIELLKDPDPIARVQAAETLGKIADPGPEIAAALVEATRDPLLNVKHTAMDALQNVDPKAYEKIRDHR